MPDRRYPPNESPVPSQQQRRCIPYWPVPDAGVFNVRPSPSGFPPDNSFVVANFDSRPLNGYDVAFRLDAFLEVESGPSQTETEFVTPLGYTTVLRGICIEGFWDDDLTGAEVSTILLENSGRVSQDAPIQFLYTSYSIHANGTALPIFPQVIEKASLNDLPAGFPVTQLVTDIYEIELFMPLPENTLLQCVITPGPNYTRVDSILYINTLFHATLVPNTGLQTPREVVNTMPIPVIVMGIPE